MSSVIFHIYIYYLMGVVQIIDFCNILFIKHFKRIVLLYIMIQVNVYCINHLLIVLIQYRITLANIDCHHIILAYLLLPAYIGIH